jgi:hypothetical protein
MYVYLLWWYLNSSFLATQSGLYPELMNTFMRFSVAVMGVSFGNQVRKEASLSFLVFS